MSKRKKKLRDRNLSLVRKEENRFIQRTPAEFPSFSAKKLEFSSAFSILGILFLAVTVSLLSALNPFSKMAPWIDSSAFLAIGRWMHEGIFPYRDIFDHKGPLLYGINFLGMFFGKLGVWICELVFLGVAISFAYKIARIWLGRIAAFISTAILFSFSHSIFTFGNMPEEYAMAFLFSALFIYIKIWHLIERNSEAETKTESTAERQNFVLRRFDCGFLGASFAATFFLKPNLVAIWIVFSGVLLIWALRSRRGHVFLNYLFWFLIGAVLVATPILALLIQKRAFFPWIEQTFLFSAQYSGAAGDAVRFLKNVVLAFNANYLAASALLVHLLLSYRFRKTIAVYFHCSLALAILLSVFAFSRSPYLGNHYYMTLLPLSLPIIVLCVERLLQKRLQSPIFIGVLMALSGGILAAQGFRFYNSVEQILFPFNEHSTDNSKTKRYTSYTTEKLAKVRANTPRNAKSVVVVGSNCNLYSCTDALPVSRYIYQWPIGVISREIAAEFQEGLRKNPPDLLFLAWPYVQVVPELTVDFNTLNKDFPALRGFLDEHYERIYSEAGLTLLYRKK